MLPSEVIVETVEVALSRPTLVVRFDNVLLFTVPVIGYDAAVGVPISSEQEPQSARKMPMCKPYE